MKHAADQSRLARLMPSPLTSLVLLIGWLVMNGSVSAGHLLLGALLALAIPLLLAPLRGERARMMRPGLALRLLLRVLGDIVVANLEVARLILGPQQRLRPGFVWVPLRIRDPHGITMLACIITMTPGTLSADLSPERDHLLVHALHLTDEAALLASIRERYESPLIEIFEGGHRC
jgi:multicomponent K+:H+ antiporter subunit E